MAGLRRPRRRGRRRGRGRRGRRGRGIGHMAALAILQIINNAAAANGVPAQLAVAQAQQESSLNPAAYNAKSGATGLFQLEPPTAAQLGVTNSLDPVQNSNGGTKYLAQLYAQFGTWGLAL